jgi:hypothetical protein
MANHTKILLSLLSIPIQLHAEPTPKKREEKKAMPKEPDTTQTQSSLTDLIDMLKQELVNCQDPRFAPHASKEERSASRFLYEQIINYQGMLRKRPLTRTVEFITKAAGPGFSHSGTGWYYQPVSLRPNSLPHINWIGPFSSHHEAEQKRIEHLPKNRTKLALAILLED